MNLTRILIKSATFLAAIVAFGLSNARAQSDDFRDGNDDGWTRYTPLAPFGASVTFSFPPGNLPFPDYQYRIESGPSPNPLTLGPARAGSFRLNMPQNLLGVTWTLVGWDSQIDQSFGAFVGVTSFGVGTLDAFGLVYSTSGQLQMLQIQDDQAIVRAEMEILLDPSKDYKLGFFRTGPSDFLGEVYAVDDLALPLASVRGFMPGFSGGAGGFYLFSNGPNGGIDATFDNFSVGIVPEPSTLSILALAALSGFWIACRRRLNSR